jgi:hypothetical protein
LDTCLYELIYSEYSILPPPKIFTIPPETPCIYFHILNIITDFIMLYKILVSLFVTLCLVLLNFFLG